MQTGPSAAQASVVYISPGQHRPLVSRHVQVQLRPLCCGVDTLRSSTGLSSVDTSICSLSLCCVDTSTEAATGYCCSDTSMCSSFPCRQFQEQHRPLQCRHAKVQHLHLIRIRLYLILAGNIPFSLSHCTSHPHKVESQLLQASYHPLQATSHPH